jgi:hypothetical protein
LGVRQTGHAEARGKRHGGGECAVHQGSPNYQQHDEPETETARARLPANEPIAVLFPDLAPKRKS